MLVLFRRHQQNCPHRDEGWNHRSCRCPIWYNWNLNGREIRKSLKTRSWQNAQYTAREMEANGIVAGVTPITIHDAYAKFLADAKSRNLSPATIRKYNLLDRMLEKFSEDRGLIFLRQLDLDKVRDFRNTWKMNSLTGNKMLDRLKSFFKFCLDSKWIDDNPAKLLRPSKVDNPEVLPFTEPEIKKILKACSGKSRLLTELMLYTGLRIGDACTISRNKFVHDQAGWRVILRTAKSGFDVSILIPNRVATSILALPGEYPFWTGPDRCKKDACSGYWRKIYDKVFTKTKLDGHPHQFRHTFAKRLLIRNVPLETVSILCGHEKLQTTERYYARFVPERQAAIDEHVRSTWNRP